MCTTNLGIKKSRKLLHKLPANGLSRFTLTAKHYTSAQHKVDECTCPPTSSRENRIRQQHITAFMPITLIAFLSFPVLSPKFVVHIVHSFTYYVNR